MKFSDINKIKDFGQIYHLKGDEYLCDYTKKKILKNLNIQPINISFFDEENFNAQDIINCCNQFSFFQENRIVVIKNQNKEINNNEKKLFNDYKNNPNNNCNLLIINSKAFEFLQIETIDCSTSESFAVDFIVKSFKEKNKSINNQTALYLAQICLMNTNKINLEIKKICDYLGDKSQVEKSHIDLLVSKDIELKTFDLINALGDKNKNKALLLLNDMITINESPIKILSLISGQFRRMMFAKISKISGLELSKQLGCKEYAIIKAKSASENFTARQLKNIQNLILEADYNIKNGQMTQNNAIYYLILNILNL